MRGRGEARGEMRQEARPTAVALCSPGVSVCQRVSESVVTMFHEKYMTLGVREGPDFGLKNRDDSCQDGVRHVRQPDIRF